MRSFRTDKDLKGSIKAQFSRTCATSQQIIVRMVEDFMTRYASKLAPHPNFFKQDVDLAHNQLTLFQDQCRQAFSKFDFLAPPSQAVDTLVGASIRFSEFLAKLVINHVKQEQASKLPTVEVARSLCVRCGRIKENERMKQLKEQLEGVIEDEETQQLREGAYLDSPVEDLANLNEEQILRRLGSLQEDHDRRRKEMSLCVDHLHRANQKLRQYGVSINKHGNEKAGMFNVKEYAFKLGRHFYHNISTLDSKIKSLKHNLSVSEATATQTDFPLITVTEHRKTVKDLVEELAQAKHAHHDARKAVLDSHQKLDQARKEIEDRTSQLNQFQIMRAQEKQSQFIEKNELTQELAQARCTIDELRGILKDKSKQEDAVCQTKEPRKLRTQKRVPTVKKGKENLSKTQLNDLDESFVIKKPESRNVKMKIELQMSVYWSPSEHLHEQNYGFSNWCTEVMGEPKLGHIPKVMGQTKKTKKHKLSKARVSKQLGIKTFDLSRDKGQKRASGQVEETTVTKIGRSSFTHKTQKNDSYLQKDSVKNYSTKRLSHVRGNSDSAGLLTVHQTSQNTPPLPYLNPRSSITMKADSDLVSALHRLRKTRNLSQEHLGQQRYRLNQFRRKSLEVDEYQPLGESQRRILIGHLDCFPDKNILQTSTNMTLSLDEINYSTYFSSLLAQLHLTMPHKYSAIRDFLEGLQGATSVREAISFLLVSHRKCKGDGAVCGHLSTFLERVKRI